MNDGLKDTQRDAIIGVLKKCPKLERARLFGSRAMGTFTSTSDVDIALEGDLSLSDQAKLSEKLERLTIPYKVDLVRVKEISSRALKEQIEQYGVVWYAREDGAEEGTTDEHGWTRMGGASGGDGGVRGWQLVPLGPYCDKIGSGSTPRGGSSVYMDSGEFALVRSQNIYNDRFDPSGLVYISKNAAKKLSNVELKPSDVLLNITGDSVARVCLISEEFLPARVNQHVAIIRVKENEFDHRFVRYFLVAPSTQELLLSLASSGATRNALTKAMIEAFEVPKPTLPEQKKIADILTALDDKIALNRKLNATLEGMARALFQSWFVDFDPVKAKLAAVRHGRDPERACMAAISGKLRIPPGKPKPEALDEQFPSAEELDTAIAALDDLTPAQQESLAQTAVHFPADFQESELGLIPEGWEVSPVENLIERFPVGKRYAQKTAKVSGKIPILDQGKSGLIGFHNNEPGVLASPDYPIIVFANHTCYMRLIMHNFSAIQNVLPFKGTDRNIFWVYCATFGQQEFVEYKGHWPDFMIKKICKPSEGLCAHFGVQVRDSFVKIFELEKESLTLAELRDTLLPKLLSGELKPLYQ